MDTAERFDLATRHTQEVVTDEELETLFADEEEPTAYIGYAPTGEMHIGHFTTMRKLADFLQAGVDVTVLVADLHAHLDDEKSLSDLLDARLGVLPGGHRGDDRGRRCRPRRHFVRPRDGLPARRGIHAGDVPHGRGDDARALPACRERGSFGKPRARTSVACSTR